MSRAIERIKITEIDMTTAAQAEEDSLDVVYVPGLCGVKYVTLTKDCRPDENTQYIGIVNDCFTNLADMKSWICTGSYVKSDESVIYQWELCDFIAPIFTAYDEYGNIDIDETSNILQLANTLQMISPKFVTSCEDFRYNFGTQYQNIIVDSKKNSTILSDSDSIVYAYDLLNAGLPVLYHCGYKYTTDASAPNCYVMNATANDIFEKMNTTMVKDSCFYELVDPNEYDVKYITTGVYAAGSTIEKSGKYDFEYSHIIDNMIAVATARGGDAFAIIDAGIGQSVVKESALYNVLVAKDGIKNGKFATALAPWGKVRTTNGIKEMPPSFCYLTCYADSIRTNGSHMSIAGVNRGIVSNFIEPILPIHEKLSNAVADSWQDVDSVAAVNAITYIRNYGYCIWGNRTLNNNAQSKGLIDSSFLNIRNMLCDIKKIIRNVALGILFEPNSDSVWSKFLFGIEPALDNFKATGGISNYRIIRQSSDDKTKLKAMIKIVTIKPIEQVEVSIILTDEDVTVE